MFLIVGVRVVKPLNTAREVSAFVNCVIENVVGRDYTKHANQNQYRQDDFAYPSSLEKRRGAGRRVLFLSIGLDGFLEVRGHFSLVLVGTRSGRNRTDYGKRYLALIKQRSLQLAKPGGIKIFGETLHVKNNFANGIAVFFKLKSHAGRQAGNTERVRGQTLQLKSGLIVEQDCQLTVDEAHGSDCPSDKSRERLSNHKHGHDVARDPEVTGKAAKLGFGSRHRFASHGNAFRSAARDVVLRKQTQHKVVDLNVNHHVNPHHGAVVLDRMDLGKIAIPEFTDLPHNSLPANDEVHIRVGDDGHVQSEQSELEAGVEIEMVLDVATGREEK